MSYGFIVKSQQFNSKSPSRLGLLELQQRKGLCLLHKAGRGLDTLAAWSLYMSDKRLNEKKTLDSKSKQ